MANEEIHGTLKDGTPVTIVLESASILTGMRRSRLIYEGQKDPRGSARSLNANLDVVLVRLLYADVAAAMTLFKVDGTEGNGTPLPISFEQFLTFSDVLGAQCEDAVYRMNPHWIVKTKEERESPKD